MAKEDKKSFLELHQDSMEYGFWGDEFKDTVILHLERMYNKEVRREWYITDMVINGNKVLIKWGKRTFPLTDGELKGR